MDDFRSPGLGDAGQHNDFLNVPVGDDRGGSHSNESMNQGLPMSTPYPYGLCIGIGDNPDMPRWPQREQFKKELKKYKKAQGITAKGAAERFGTTVGTLNAYLSRKDTQPSLEWLQTACGVMGISVSQFIDDPGADRPSTLDLSSFSEIDRYRFDQIIHELGDEKLTDEDRQMLFEDFKSQKMRLLSLKNRKK